MNIIQGVISLLILCSAHAITFSQCTPTGTSLATPYNTDNGQRGVMFDITAINDVYIECFDASLYAGTTADYEIYYKAGSFVGSENVASDWTLVGTTSALTSAGNNIPTPIPIPINVVIPAGQTYGFYVTNTFGGGTAYTVGGSATQNLATNADLIVTGGVGKLYPFSFTYDYRYFNGTVHYTTVIPLSEKWNEFCAAPLVNNSIRISWKIEHETTDHRYTIERSADGYAWKSVHETVVLNSTGETTAYEWIDQNGLPGHSYYRIKEIDLNGNTVYQDLAVVTRSSHLEQAPVAFPNPTKAVTHIRASADDLTNVRITDVLGREFTDVVPVTSLHSSLFELNLQQVPPGMYVLSFGSQSLLIVKE